MLIRKVFNTLKVHLMICSQNYIYLKKISPEVFRLIHPILGGYVLFYQAYIQVRCNFREYNSQKIIIIAKL